MAAAAIASSGGSGNGGGDNNQQRAAKTAVAAIASSNGSGGGLFGGGNNDDYSNNTQEVYYDGRSLSFSGDEQPIVKGSTLLVPARALASRIGASFERTEDGKRMWIRWRGREAQYDKGNIWFRINGERQSLSTISVERNEILFIPVKVFQALTENRIQVR